jgi:uncharacterized protein YjbI with pentapeptide repeats
MANPEHVAVLKQGVAVWNEWREENSETPRLGGADLRGATLRRANLRGASLRGADLRGADLYRANLNGADLWRAELRDARLVEANLSAVNLNGGDLSQADLRRIALQGASLGEADFSDANLREARLSTADLQGAVLERANLFKAHLNRTNLMESNLRQACLSEANLTWANLTEARLSEADLGGADLRRADLSHADLSDAMLSGAHLERATLVETNLSGAVLNDCHVYGVSAWGLDLAAVEDQSNLIITPPDEPTVTVDNLEVAQFVYLLLHNEKIRGVIDTIGEKGVLILGRFTAERRAVLEAIREQLRLLGYLPMLFDFERPTRRDFTETIKTLAGISRFIIADITNPSSSPLELQATIPNYMVPLVPILHEVEKPFSMFADLQGKYDWVLDVLKYDSVENLIRALEPAVVRPALEKADQLLLRRAEAIRERHVREYS